MALGQFLYVMLRDLLNIVVVLASKNVMIFEKCFGVAFMQILAHLTAHLLTLVTSKNDLLVFMHRAVRLHVNFPAAIPGFFHNGFEAILQYVDLFLDV
jgi:hypothetical protein